MKKFVAIVMMVVVLTLSLGVVAQAEGRFVGVTAIQDEYSGKVEHYASVRYDRGFFHYNVTTVHIDEELYNKLLKCEEEDREWHENLWYVKAGRWCKTTAVKAADWVTFWD